MTAVGDARKRQQAAQTASAIDQRPASPEVGGSATATPVGPHGANLDVAAIRARVEAATPGPWRWDSWRDDLHHLIGRGGSVDTYEYDVEVIEPEHAGECGCRSACHLTNEVREADREFIAHARTDIPALLAELDRLTAALAAERARVASVAKVEQRMADCALKAWSSATARHGCSDEAALTQHADALSRWSERLREAMDETRAALATPTTEETR